MTRKRISPDPELTLAPILNIVVILIPMLLLAVVFLRAGAINISTPILNPSNSERSETVPPPTVAIWSAGFFIQTHDNSPIVIETKNKEKAAGLISSLAEARQSQDTNALGLYSDALVELYDYDALYSAMERLDRENPNDGVYNLAADPAIPHAVVIRTMDAVRHRVKRRPQESIWNAERTGALFTSPVLAWAK